MATDKSFLTGIERAFSEDDIIVSKTDPRGRIIYANQIFMRISGYREDELLGQPHSIVRHPAMPRCIFKLLWDEVSAGREIFAYIVNRCKNGDHYWVLAHVTPTFDGAGSIIGYHSNRRFPQRTAVARAQSLYTTLLAEEQRHTDRKAGLDASCKALSSLLDQAKVPYDEYVFTL